MSTATLEPEVKDADDYLDLVRSVREAGLFHYPTWRTGVRLGLLTLLSALGWAAFALLGHSWYQLLVAVYLAIMFAQVAFVGHDIGHRQIFRSRRWNRVAGMTCGNLAIGISYGYWVSKHNQHHAHPNEIGADPDVGPGLISWSEEQASVKKGLGGLIARHQAGLFFPLTCLEALSLHVDSFKTMRAKGTRQASLEMALLSTHLVVLVSVLFLVLPPWHALAFLVVQQAGFGLYLGCAFAPNHKGMPMPQPGEHMSFVHRQVTTSRNVKGGRALATALGGLNYQIEHHLFPSLPMANLPRCEPLVRRYCAANAIPYAEAGLIASYAMALRHLRDSGRQVVGSSGEPLWRDS